jgi:hypothetical protein
VVDTCVKVTVKGDGTLCHSEGQALDGEPRQDGSGRPYIYSSTADLPSGDGVAGGDAAFYVGSVRGDSTGDGQVAEDDMIASFEKYAAGDLDADFRGVGFGESDPDGQITPSDIDGFCSTYDAAVAEGRRLLPLLILLAGPQG